MAMYCSLSFNQEYFDGNIAVYDQKYFNDNIEVQDQKYVVYQKYFDGNIAVYDQRNILADGGGVN